MARSEALPGKAALMLFAHFMHGGNQDERVAGQRELASYVFSALARDALRARSTRRFRAIVNTQVLAPA